MPRALRLSACAMAIFIAHGAPAWTTSEAVSLAGILKGLDRASRLYLDSALQFTCDETIAEPDLPPPLHRTFQYIFVHEEDGSLRDYRMEKGEGKRPEIDPARLGFHHFLQRAYFWVLLFHSSRQKLFHYELLDPGKTPAAGTVRIRFEAIPPYREALNDWFGTAWVDPRTFQIVHVEAMKADSHENAKRMSEDAENLKKTSIAETGHTRTYDVQTVSSDFGVVKNGMRFPTRTRVVSSVYALPGEVFHDRPHRLTVEHTVQAYRRYKFYSVRTKDEIRDLLHPELSSRRQVAPGR